MKASTSSMLSMPSQMRSARASPPRKAAMKASEAIPAPKKCPKIWFRTRPSSLESMVPAARIPLALPIIFTVLTSFYIGIYLFIAMRRVYGQGFIVTFFKYIILLIAYSFGFTMTMLGALAIAAFSI